MERRKEELVSTHNQYKTIRRFELDGSYYYEVYRDDYLYGITSKLAEATEIMYERG